MFFSFWLTSLYITVSRSIHHPCLYKGPNFIPFSGWVIVSCMYVPHFLSHSYFFKLLPQLKGSLPSSLNLRSWYLCALTPLWERHPRARPSNLQLLRGEVNTSKEKIVMVNRITATSVIVLWLQLCIRAITVAYQKYFARKRSQWSFCGCKKLYPWVAIT